MSKKKLMTSCVAVLVIVIAITYNSMIPWCKTSFFENWNNEHRRDPLDYDLWRMRICRPFSESSNTSLLIFDTNSSNSSNDIMNAVDKHIIKINNSDGKPYSADNFYILFGDLFGPAKNSQKLLLKDRFIQYGLILESEIYATINYFHIQDILRRKISKKILYELDSKDIYTNSILTYVSTCTKAHPSTKLGFRIRSMNTLLSNKIFGENISPANVINGRFGLIGSPCLTQKDFNSLMLFLVANNFSTGYYSQHSLPQTNRNISISTLKGEVYITFDGEEYFMYWLIILVTLLIIYFSVMYIFYKFTTKLKEPIKMYRYRDDGRQQSFYIWTPSLISNKRSNMGILNAYFLHRSPLNCYYFANILLSSFCLSFYFMCFFNELYSLLITLAYVITVSGSFLFCQIFERNMQWFLQLHATEQSIWICSLPLAVCGCFGLKEKPKVLFYCLLFYFAILSYVGIIDYYLTHVIRYFYEKLLSLVNIDNATQILVNWFHILLVIILYIKDVISYHQAVYHDFIKYLITFFHGENFQLPQLDEGEDCKKQAVLHCSLDMNRNELLNDDSNHIYKTASGAMIFYKEDGEICITAKFFFEVMSLPGSPFPIKLIIFEETLSILQRSLPAIVVLWILLYVLHVPIESLNNKSENVKLLMIITQTVIVKLYSDIFFKLSPREKINYNEMLGLQNALKDFVRKSKDEFFVSMQGNKLDIPFNLSFTLIIFGITIFVFIFILFVDLDLGSYIHYGSFSFLILAVFAPLFCFFSIYLQST